MTVGRPRALVLGATGHIGQAVVRELLGAGYRVRAATRQLRPAALAGLDVETVHGDADEPGRLAAWVHGQDTVFDAAAPYPLNRFVAASSAERAPLAHARRRMAALLDAVAREGAVLAHVSSCTTLPRPATEGPLAAIEARARRRLHPYFAVKAAMEAMVLDATRRGLRAVVVNPTACLGPGDRRPRELCVVPLLATREVPVMMAHALNVIDVRDVAVALRAAVEQQRYGVPIALAGHDCRSDLLAARVCRLAGVAPPRLHTPARVAAAGALWVEAAWALLGRASPLPAIGQLLVLDAYPMQPGAAQRALGALPRPLEETLRDALDWYRSLGYC